jgi:hypothetical protein
MPEIWIDFRTQFSQNCQFPAGVGKLIEKQLKYSTLLYCVRPVGSFDGGSYDTCYTVESSIRNGKQISNEFILDISDINEDYAGTLYPII